jgi:hypothetical protein
LRGSVRLRRIARALRYPRRSIGSFANKHLIGPRLERFTSQLGPGLTLIEELPIPPSYPIDVVYTWVDDQEPDFIESLNSHLPEGSRNRTTTSRARFKNHDELKYSLRSLSAYAPWVNRIFIVTNGQRPAWISDHPKLQFVHHKDILDASYLPTFNSHVIESALHKIPGLSEHYVYFNDDVLLLRPLETMGAFSVSGKSYAYLTQDRLSPGPPVSYETATEWGAKNARDLIHRQFGHSFDRRFSHMFHSQRRSVSEHCERLFAEAYDTMRQNKFRGINDLLCCGFLHHYVGYLAGETLFRTERGHHIFIRSAAAKAQYSMLLKQRDAERGRHVVCLNDFEAAGGGIFDYQEALRGFMDAYFPQRSPFEES